MTTDSDSTDSDEESLPIADVITQLHRKYPRLNFPQYLPLLEGQGIVYAESVTGFDEEYFTSLGIAEGAVKPFLLGVRKVMRKEKKRAKVSNKENHSRFESVEI